MKLKTLATLAACAFLATSLANATPELTADDMSAGNNEPTAVQSNDMATQTGSTSNIGSATATSGMNNTNSNDDMSADTATGDDDY